MTGRTPALVILAAGASRRMGQCKALVEIGGKSAIRRILEADSSDGSEVPLIVSGADHAAIRAHLGSEFDLVFNEHWAEGRGTSLRTAQASRPDRDLLIAPVDHPMVRPETFAALRQAWTSAGCPAMGWIAPRVEQPGGTVAFGHPIVVGRELIARSRRFTGADSLRTLRSQADPLQSIPAGPEVLLNVDSPEDLERIRHREKSSQQEP